MLNLQGGTLRGNTNCQLAREVGKRKHRIIFETKLASETPKKQRGREKVRGSKEAT